MKTDVTGRSRSSVVVARTGDGFADRKKGRIRCGQSALKSPSPMRAYQEHERDSRDCVAPRYDQWYIESKGRWFDRRERAVIGRAICPDSIVLDLGSGTGRITESVAQKTAFTIALDISLNSLRYLQDKRIPRVAAVGADAVAGLPFRTGAFDAVVSCQVVQHLMDEDIRSALRECHRVLKAGGRLHLAVYNLEYWRFHRVPQAMDEGGLYYRRFDASYIRDLAAAAQFSVMNIGYYKTLPAKVTGGCHLFDDLLIQADRCICRIPLLRRLVSVYLFASLEAQS
jgi:SAM-dependent methyltransferase